MTYIKIINQGFLLFLLLSVLPVSAGVVVIHAERLLQVESGRITSPAVVVVENDRISAVNPGQIPAAERIDLGNMTLLPGLMDMHTHLLYDIEGDWVHRKVKEQAADLSLRGAKNARLTLQAGFTTVRDVGGRFLADIALMKAIDLGFVEGPRMFPAGKSLSITGGHCDITGLAPGIMEFEPREGVADGVDEVLKAVRYQIKYGARVIKFCATAGVLSFEKSVGAQQYTFEEMRAIVEEAARHDVKVAAHAHGTEGIITAVKAGVHSIEHGSLLNKDAIRLMKKHGTYLVPTTYLADAIDLENLHPQLRAKAEYILPKAKESVRRAIKDGVRIAYGTDAAVFPHGENAKEFAALVERGMTVKAAIQSATVNAADLLGVDDRGRISPGLLADIIAVEGNPLEDITVLENVRFVMKGGVVYKQP